MSKLTEFSTIEELDFFLQSNLNSKVKTFVFDTIDYFDEPRKGTVFTNLNFLQLLHKQIDNIEKNLSKPYSNVQQILGLPLNELEKHILFGFILKKYGGYPIKVDPYQKISIVLKLIEAEFLKFDKDTPEKKYCLRLDSQSFTPPLNESKPESYKFTHKDVEAYSYNYDWDYYLGMDIIANIVLVLETISYFESGNRKGFIEPLTALNFIHFQKTYLNENCSKPFENLAYFKSLDIDEELRHVMYFFLVKWNGGSFHSMNSDFENNYRLIKKELEKYEGETPEKIELGLIKTVENDPELIPIIEELSRKESVTSKFDYWLTVKGKFKDYFPQKLSIDVPIQPYEKFFESLIENSEFLNCLLKYEANSWFESIKSVENLEAKVKSTFSQDFIKAELLKIEQFAEEANISLKGDIYRHKSKYNYEQQKFLVYLRLKEGYYQKGYNENRTLSEYYPLTLDDVQINSDVVMVYANYKIKKEYLEKHLLKGKLEETSNSLQCEEFKEDIVEGFESYFEIEEPKIFLNELKNEFNKSDLGKSFGYLFYLLVDKKILKLSGSKTKFYTKAREYLKIEIGKDSGINRYFNFALVENQTHKKQIDLILNRLEIVLKKHQESIKK